jgi:hypothetical protein
VERAEAKVFANRERYKNFFVTLSLRRAYGKLFTFSGNYQDALRIFAHLQDQHILRTDNSGSLYTAAFARNNSSLCADVDTLTVQCYNVSDETVAIIITIPSSSSLSLFTPN